MIKSLITFQMSQSFPLDVDSLSNHLENVPFVPCSGTESKRIGWDEIPGGGSVAARKLDDFLVCICTIEKKSVPAATVKIQLQEDIEEFTRINGVPPGKKELKILKSEAKLKLIPRAFPKRTSLTVWIDTRNNLIHIDTSSSSAAEDIVRLLRHTCHDVDMPYLSHLKTNDSFSGVVTGWLLGDDTPEAFTVDDECELVSPDKASIKYKRQNLDHDELRSYIAAGKLLSSVSLTHNNTFTFSLNGKLVIKSIKPTDMMNKRALDNTAGSNEFFADFMLYSKASQLLVQDLIHALGGQIETEEPQDEDEDGDAEDRLAA